MEGPRNFVRNLKEEAKEKIAYTKSDIKNYQQDKLFEKLKDIRQNWKQGPVDINIIPASFMHDFIEDKDLKALGEFKEAYPTLAIALKEVEEAGKLSPLIIGQIDIAGGKWDEKGEEKEYTNYMEGGTSTARAAIKLKRDVVEALKALAVEIKQGGNDLEKAEYFIGISRLATIAKNFGFDTYDLPYDPDRKHFSYDYAAIANEESGMSPEEAKEKAHSKPVALAVISKKRLLELYGQ